MEASPLFTLHLGQRGNVRFDDDRAILEQLELADETAVRLLRERLDAGGDPAAVARDALEIGARVLDREQAAANTDLVKAEMERAAHSISELFEAQMLAFGGTLAEQMERHFSDDSAGAVQHRVREIVEATSAKSHEELLRQFFADDGRNPIAGFQKVVVAAMRQTADHQVEAQRALETRVAGLQAELQGLRAEKASQQEVAAERERGTAKGRTYEEAVFAAVDAIAAAGEDCAEPTGDVAGAGGRKGDVVVAIDGAAGPARGTIVFEAKDRQRVSRRQALADLDASMQQRSADFAVWVVPTEQHLPSGVRDLREVDGTKLFVVFDAAEGTTQGLELAYKLARARVLLARDEVEGLDGQALGDTVERARLALEDARRIKGQLTSATSSIENARGLVDGLATAVRGQLDELDELIASARPG